MERLQNGAFLSQPLVENERERFLELYLEYRNHFPVRPARPLSLVEKLSAAEFHGFRIMRWLEFANNKELQREGVLKIKEFIPRFEKALAIIRQEFAGRRMVYCHGHFKPHDIFKSHDGVYCLTDFAHAKMYPEGYELAFIIWADQMMDAPWDVEYKKWRIGIFDWVNKMRHVGKKLNIERFGALLRAALVERIMGSILADVTASDRPHKEKLSRIRYLYRLFGELTALEN